MNSFIHEFCAAVAVYTLLVGVLTVAVRAALSRRLRRAPLQFGGSHTVLLLAAPTLVAGIWAISSLLHHLEPGRSLADCCVALAAQVGPGEFFWLGFAALITYSGVTVIREILRERSLPRSSCEWDKCASRVEVLCARDPELKPLESVIQVTKSGPAAVARGLLRPRIELNHHLLGEIGDEELRAVLHHEAEHLRSKDPGRLMLSALAIGLNPFGKFLGRAFDQWKFGRELACDLRAVQRGADPLALANAIVTAARSTCALPAGWAGIASPSIDQVRARVQLLMTYADKTPSEHVGQNPPYRNLAALGAALVAVPHVAAPLFAFHCFIERGLHAIVG